MFGWPPPTILSEQLEEHDETFRKARLHLDTTVREESASITRARGRGELLESLLAPARIVAWPANIPTWQVQEAQVELQSLLKELDG